MALYYRSGEAILNGDRVLLNGNPAEIEFVADPEANPGDWYVREFGGGVMVIEPREFGRLFVRPDEDYATLFFLSRASPEP